MSTAMTPEILERVRIGLQRIIDEAYEDGIVITVECVPNTPLAMGHYTPTVHVRERRDRAN